MAAGLARASALAVTYLDVASAMKVLDIARTHAPQVPAIVRTKDDHDLEKLRTAGATEVVPEALEGSLMLASHALALVGVPVRRVWRIVQELREERYDLLRGYFHGADDPEGDSEAERLATVTLPMGARTGERTLGNLALHAMGVRVVSLRRGNGQAADVGDDLVLMDGDTLVLSGRVEPLARAEEKLLEG